MIGITVPSSFDPLLIPLLLKITCCFDHGWLDHFLSDVFEAERIAYVGYPRVKLEVRSVQRYLVVFLRSLVG
jgi:hypothetical protein